MLIGSFKYAIDSKNRVSIPAKLRKYIDGEGNNKFYINRGVEKCIDIYPSSQWKELADKLEHLNPFNSKDSMFLRVFLQKASEETLDSQFRILLPQNLIEHAEIENEVFILGAIKKIEIWNPSNYEKYLQQQDESFEQIAEKVMSR
ncbi:MAG: division/cell wall cluster transcriptional repressor MraZ [Ignavibacteriales bacterium]|nr:division/cell wall cluster transcriptional repressor MraZ [Ignavibacteriales bacterium]